MLSTKVYVACVRLKRLPIVDAWFIKIIPFYRTDRACLKILMRIEMDDLGERALSHAF